MATEIVKGTFTATGTSDPITGHRFDIALDFGTGSVDIEVLMHTGNWIKEQTAITADDFIVWESAAPETIRLNCTAYTAAIAYQIKRGENR